MKIVEQICVLHLLNPDEGDELGKSIFCKDCPHCKKTWNLDALIDGLKWILEGNYDEEHAGYIIRRTIEYLEGLKGDTKNE